MRTVNANGEGNRGMLKVYIEFGRPTFPGVSLDYSAPIPARLPTRALIVRELLLGGFPFLLDTQKAVLEP